MIGAARRRAKSSSFQPQCHRYVLDVNDNLRQSEAKRSISRMELANHCFASLSFGAGEISFDCITKLLDDCNDVLQENNKEFNDSEDTPSTKGHFNNMSQEDFCSSRRGIQIGI